MDARFHTDDQVVVFSLLSEYGGEWFLEDIARALGMLFWRTRDAVDELLDDGFVLQSSHHGHWAFSAVLGEGEVTP